MCLSLQIAAREHLRELARLRRVRDRIGREHAHPLDLEALARMANLPVTQFVDRFRLAYGHSPHDYQRVVRTVRNREARAGEAAVA